MASTAQHFGHVIKLWFRACDFPQGITQKWSKALPEGEAPHGPWASQVSQSIKGNHDPKTGFWLGWAQFNHAVHTGNYMGKVTDRQLIDQLNEGRPLLHEDGEPWQAMDFFGLFVGEIDEPDWIKDLARVMQPEDIEQWVEGLRADFHKICMDRCIARPDGWALVEAALEGHTAGDLLIAKEITIGFREPTIREATQLHMQDHKLPRLADALERLANAQKAQMPVPLA